MVKLEVVNMLVHGLQRMTIKEYSMSGKPETKYVSIASDLKDCLNKGKYEDRLPNIKDLAFEYSVTPITMNKALEVLIDEGLLYKRRGMGTFVRKLNGTKVTTLGVVLGDIYGPLTGLLLRGIEKATRKRGYHIKLGLHHDRSDQEDQIIRDFANSQEISGLLIWPSSNEHEQKKFLEDLLVSAKPSVLVADQTSEEMSRHFSSVYCDDRAGISSLMNAHFEKGHKKIAFYAGDSFKRNFGRLRYDYYCVEMKKQGLTPELLQELDKKNLSQYSAIVCVNDLCAAEVYKTIYKFADVNLSQISISGFDSNILSKELGFMSIDPGFESIGEKAVEVLLSEIETSNTERVQYAVNPILKFNQESK